MIGKFFSKMVDAVKATKENLVNRIENLVLGEKKIDEHTLDELEAILIGADIGVTTTTEVLERVRAEVKRDQVNDYETLIRLLKDSLLEILVRAGQGAPAAPAAGPRILFVVGVNGVGKTTTIGKLANRLSLEGEKVVVCAADTFRAAAIEQLEIWAQRSGVPIIKKEHGADPSAVLFDAIEKAQNIGAGTVIVDTAGRLHTKANLMKELEKMTRTAARKVEGAPHEVLLILDATTGQNGVVQAREFLKTSGVTGLVVTKLDGTAKGGVVVAIARELNLPIRYVGIGEKMDDIIDFNPEDYVESIFARS